MKRERLRRLVHPHIIGKFSVDLLGYSLRPNLIEASSSLGIKSREAWRIWIKVLPLSKTRSWPWSSQKTYLKVSNRQTSSNIVTMNILTTGRLACVYSPLNTSENWFRFSHIFRRYRCLCAQFPLRIFSSNSRLQKLQICMLFWGVSSSNYHKFIKMYFL